MTIAVTGATGFLGSALVTELVKQQQDVRILARDEKKAREQFGEAVTVVRGDITDEEQVKRLVDGATTVYHLVGHLYHPSVPTELYRRTHSEGTRILLECLQRAEPVTTHRALQHNRSAWRHRPHARRRRCTLCPDQSLRGH